MFVARPKAKAGPTFIEEADGLDVIAMEASERLDPAEARIVEVHPDLPLVHEAC